MDCDVAIVGGGIHGVGVAQAAAAAGYSVILLEQYSTLAQGTSSRSSKLIHGGLRYLENFDFALVAECLRERHYLLQNAPSIVKLKPVFIPVFARSRRPPWMIRAGLSLYALLGGLKKEARFCKVKNYNIPELALLDKTNLRAVFRYYEAQTDDSMLTVAVMRSAQDMGADLRLGCAVQKIAVQEQGCVIEYLHNNTLHSITAASVVNAAGPWVSRVQELITPRQQNVAIDLVQGTHIILPFELGENIYYIESPIDGRPVFVMPWYGDTMVGTTELVFDGNPADTKPTGKEIEYLLETFYAHFPALKNKNLPSCESFSGLRVLPRSTQNANKRSRETIYLCDRKTKPRVVSIFGGKLTAYRATAEIALSKIKPSLPIRSANADTKNINLFG